jgi:hypothetical protein
MQYNFTDKSFTGKTEKNVKNKAKSIESEIIKEFVSTKSIGAKTIKEFAGSKNEANSIETTKLCI